MKITRKKSEQEELITNLETFYNSREEDFDFLKTISKWCLTLNAKQDNMKLKEQDLKY